MCGIAGFFDLRSRAVLPDGKQRLLQQIYTCSYRGPDAKQVWNGAGVGLAHARLSVIDLSSAANQPMTSADGRMMLIFNGEIYNFRELRAELEEKGRRFRTCSDSEVIVEGYCEWGTDIVSRLRGMFAIALYDSERDELVLMRDRVGKKPLVYGVSDGKLLFGSEIKTILRWPGFPREADLDSIDEYLTYQYVPAPRTAFRGIFKLPAAHVLVARRGREPRIERYWNLPPPNGTRQRSDEELCEELVYELRQATRLRMIADVPLGAFLSGGVDSSSVVAMMAMELAKPIKTFTIGFKEQKYDERPFARAVAERYATDHHEMVVEANAMDVLLDLVYHYNEPFADSSAIPTYYVAQVARRHVTVALNGDGGDESFLGHPRYLYCRRLGLAEHLPPFVRKNLRHAAHLIPQSWQGKYVRQARAALSFVGERRSRRYEQFVTYFSDDAKKPLYGARMRHHLERSALDRLDRFFDEAPSFALGAAWADTHTYLPDDLLVKVDIASMANSLEARSPLLDHHLMSWAAQIPEHQRFAGDEPKSLFKKAMEPYLPADLLYRPKMGFGVPLEQWLRTDLKDFAYVTLTSKTAAARGLFDPDHVRLMLDLHCQGQNWAPRLWALLMLELWFQMWIDTPDAFAHPVAQRLGSVPANLAA